jgi:capsular polysaccharide transport system ATP-binding protein
MIRFENVVKRYETKGEDKWILRGLTLALPPGRNIGILGANGAGKSTLIRLIAGSEDPDYGVIHRDCRVSWPLGFKGGIAGQMSGRDACMFVSRLYGVDARRVMDYVRDFSELGDYFHEPVSNYSSGMKAKLAFGLSMALDFDYYLIDEVTAVGDRRFRAKCLEAFQERRRRSQVILVSHSENTLREYCDCGALLKDGHLTIYPDLDEAIAIYGSMMDGQA